MFALFAVPVVVRVGLPHQLTFFANMADTQPTLTFPSEPELAAVMRCEYAYDADRASAGVVLGDAESPIKVPMQPSGTHSFQGDFKSFKFVDGTWLFVGELMARAFTGGDKSISKERVMQLFGADVLVVAPDTNPKYGHRNDKKAIDGSTQWIYYNEDVSGFLAKKADCSQ